MIEVITALAIMEQNPAYRFAADIPLSVKRKGLFILQIRLVKNIPDIIQSNSLLQATN